MTDGMSGTASAAGKCSRDRFVPLDAVNTHSKYWPADIGRTISMNGNVRLLPISNDDAERGMATPSSLPQKVTTSVPPPVCSSWGEMLTAYPRPARP